MGKKAVLAGFWIVGFALGAAAWYLKTPALQFVESIGLSGQIGEALLAGLFGSMVMVLTVLTWSFLSPSK